VTRPGATPYASRGRRSWVLRWIFLALLVVPMVEVAVIVAVGRAIGGWPTFALLLVESLIGAVIVKREGGRSWAALRDALRSGRMPSRQIADAALVLVGGTLLLTPGFVTDAVGFFVILPFTRPITRRWLEAAVARRLLGPFGDWPGSGDAGNPGGGGTAPRGGGGPPDVIQGEIVDD
jgi:UPF0716 protein FxsA